MNMISNYTAYINQFMSKGSEGKPSPGEHHFVATYLVPRVFKLKKQVPDYVNPDGTKKVFGDIVYYKNGKHHLGVEVKYQTIRLTKNEYNNWIANDRRAQWPNIFIGIGTEGLIVLPWVKFRSAYIASTGADLVEIDDGYGPMKSVNVLFREGIGKKGYFIKGSSRNSERKSEIEFMKLLATYLKK